MIGPNIAPTLVVPRDWIMNRKMRSPSAMGMTQACRAGLTTVRPSTADSTEMAGVIIESP